MFEVSSEPGDYEFVQGIEEKAGKHRFMKCMTKFLKHIGLKLKALDARKRSRKQNKNKSKETVRQKYYLQRLFEIKLNVNN